MENPIIIAKIAGVALLVFTIRSIYKHFTDHKTKSVTPPKDEKRPSISEQFLNNFLLYLWLAFMVIFSTGLIVNN